MKFVCKAGSLRSLCIFALIGLLAQAAAFQAQAATTLSFTLDKSGKTSAGIYDGNDTLIKTLWKNKRFGAGSHNILWDNTDDSGNTVTGTNYTAKVISHNVNYVWEGLVANNSDVAHGRKHIRSTGQFSGMATDGSSLYLSHGYTERQPLYSKISQSSIYRFDKTGRNDAARTVDFVDTDGTRVYLANTGNGTLSAFPSFTLAVNCSDMLEYTFPNGQAIPDQSRAQPWKSAIDVEAGSANSPSGLAVQKTGNYLAVSHKGLDVVRIFDKVSGAAIPSKNISCFNPLDSAFDPQGRLWVIQSKIADGSTGRQIRLYDLTTSPPSVVTTISGAITPVAIAVDPRSTVDKVFVADVGDSGSTIHRVKVFSSTNGTTPSAIYGRNESYSNNPTVHNDKFFFQDQDNIRTFLAVEDDGSFWVHDRGNYRTLHFTSAGAYIEEIASRGRVRMTCADTNDPERMFVHFAEYEIDYSKPLKPNNGSWKLVRNWGWATNNWLFNGIFSAQTIEGHTYVMIGGSSSRSEDYFDLVPDSALYELTPTGIRRTTYSLNDYSASPHWLDRDGSMHLMDFSSSTAVVMRRKPFLGIDAGGNPTFGPAVNVASAPKGALEPIWRTSGFAARWHETADGKVTVFDPSNSGSNDHYHLGAVPVGGSSYAWRTSPSGYTDFLGMFQTKEQDPEIQGAGNYTNVIDRNVLYGYHGENWQYAERSWQGRGQANQTMHYFDNGLFVGQFGEPNYFGHPLKGAGLAEDEYAVPGMAGNTFTPVLVRSPQNNKVYLYHGDDSIHGGAHRWRIDGFDDIEEFTGSGPVNGTIPLNSVTDIGTGLTGAYFDDKLLTSTALKTTRVDPTVNFDWTTTIPAGTAITSPTTYSARWTGKVKAPVSGTYTFTVTGNDGVRLWVNGTEIFTGGWISQPATAYSGPITLTAGQKYDIKLEYYQDTASASVKLEWAYPGQVKQVVPKQYLFPVISQTSGQGTGLLGHYFKGTNFDNLVTTRLDSEVHFDWGESQAIAGVGPSNYTVRWTGKVETIEAGTYTFRALANDVARLWVDNVLVVDRFSSSSNTDNGTIALATNTKYDIKMEMRQTGGTAHARLEWQRPGDNLLDIIPETQLYPDPSAIPPVISGGIYTLKARHSGLPLAVKLASTTEGAKLIQDTANGAPAQQWIIEPSSPGYYRLRSVLSSKLTSITSDALTDGADAVQRDNSNVSAQEWSIEPVGGGYYKLINRNSGKALEVDVNSASNGGFSSTAAGAQAQQWNYGGATNQQWTLNWRYGAEVPVGTGTGLKGQYYSGQSFGTLITTRTDATINFDWGTSGPATSVGPDSFSVRWTGQIQPLETGVHTFEVTADDGEQLWINGVVVIDKLTNAASPNSVAVLLEAGRKYDIRLDYYDSTGEANCTLRWKRPNTNSMNVVPQSQLYPAP